MATDFETARQSAKVIIENAYELARKDRRVRMLIDSSVVNARGELGRYIDPENADEEAFRLAERACAILASRILTEDAELHAMRIERDRYKRLAEESLMARPSPSVITPAHERLRGLVETTWPETRSDSD
jgi:hypothetical protein